MNMATKAVPIVSKRQKAHTGHDLRLFPGMSKAQYPPSNEMFVCLVLFTRFPVSSYAPTAGMNNEVNRSGSPSMFDALVGLFSPIHDILRCPSSVKSAIDKICISPRDAIHIKEDDDVPETTANAENIEILPCEVLTFDNFFGIGFGSDLFDIGNRAY
jgi:hypothetical protein